MNVASFTALFVALGFAPGPKAPLRAIPEAAKAVPRKPVVEFVRGAFDGRVTNVNKDSITIEGAGTQPAGPVLFIEGVKRFELSNILKSGDYPRDWGGGYRISDVQHGDKVITRYSRIDGVDICTHIIIRRRPDGSRPIQPGTDPDPATESPPKKKP